MGYIKKSYNLTTKNSEIHKWAKDWNWHFSKEDTRIANNHVKTCSVSLAIVEAQTNLSEIAPHIREGGCDRKTDSSKRWQGRGQVRAFAHLW